MFDDVMGTVEVDETEPDARASDEGAPRTAALRSRGPATSRRGLTAVAMGAGLLASACGPGVKRDLSTVPVGQVGFDDLCGLQSYYDTIAIKQATPPAVIDAADIERISEGNTARGGRARFAFETDFQLTTVRRVLEENWKDLPPGLSAAKRIELNVTWSERAGLRRVANNSSPELVADGVAVSLPYHVCLSELLFGEKIYQRRREVLGLAPRPTAHSLALGPDAGAPSDDAAAEDGGLAPSSPVHSTVADAGSPPSPASEAPPGPSAPGAAGRAGPVGGK